MARDGFLRRIANALGIRRAPKPERAPPPEPPSSRRDEYRDIWRQQRAKGSYRKHLRVFHSMIDPIEDDESEREQLWDSYVRHMVKGEGRFRRNSTSNMFWRDSGIDPQDFNWQRWREAMGFTGSRRSRTA